MKYLVNLALTAFLTLSSVTTLGNDWSVEVVSINEPQADQVSGTTYGAIATEISDFTAITGTDEQLRSGDQFDASRAALPSGHFDSDVQTSTVRRDEGSRTVSITGFGTFDCWRSIAAPGGEPKAGSRGRGPISRLAPRRSLAGTRSFESGTDPI